VNEMRGVGSISPVKPHEMCREVALRKTHVVDQIVAVELKSDLGSQGQPELIAIPHSRPERLTSVLDTSREWASTGRQSANRSAPSRVSPCRNDDRSIATDIEIVRKTLHSMR
jgi:hypothetical protein